MGAKRKKQRLEIRKEKTKNEKRKEKKERRKERDRNVLHTFLKDKEVNRSIKWRVI